MTKNAYRALTSRNNVHAIPCRLLAVALMAGAFFSGVVNSQEVQELGLNKDSLAKALASSEGWVQGYLPDEEAQPLQLITKSNFPVLVRITVVQRFEQKQCGRVQVDISQENVPTKDLSTITYIAPPVQLNVCADGDPPENAVDVTQATQEATSKSRKELRAGAVHEK